MSESSLEKVLRLATSQVRGYARNEKGRREWVQAHSVMHRGEAHSDWIPPDKWAEGQRLWKEHGKAEWEEHLRGRGLGDRDVKLLSSQMESHLKAAEASQPAQPGTREHAEELRGLAREAELATGRNVISMKSGHEGTQSDFAEHFAAGDKMRMAGEPEYAMTLRRAADMLDKGQPSLARVHAFAIRAAAAQEAHARPDYASRLRIAADKLSQLPQHQGLAAQPKATKEFTARTAAARRYARRKTG